MHALPEPGLIRSRACGLRAGRAQHGTRLVPGVDV